MYHAAARLGSQESCVMSQAPLSVSVTAGGTLREEPLGNIRIKHLRTRLKRQGRLDIHNITST